MPRKPAPQPIYKAYISEPITRCPPREKGRIRTLLGKIAETLAEEPYRIQSYIPSLITSPEARAHMLPEHVYLLDRIRVVESDLVLVAADHASFGIGGEVEMATSLGKPVIIFSRARKLSRFLIGTPANTVKADRGDQYYLSYRDWRDLKPQLLPLVEKALERAAPMREHAYWDIGARVRRVRARRNLSLETLAERSGVPLPQLHLLEKSIDEICQELNAYQESDALQLGSVDLSPFQLEQLANIGVPMLHRLAAALAVPVSELLGEGAPTAPPKSPAREAETRRDLIVKGRTESLKVRAALFDVTFREYERLRVKLVDDFVAGLPLPPPKGQALQNIAEQEFRDALDEIRGPKLV